MFFIPRQIAAVQYCTGCMTVAREQILRSIHLIAANTDLDLWYEDP
jgi:hypothetical protein